MVEVRITDRNLTAAIEFTSSLEPEDQDTTGRLLAKLEGVGTADRNRDECYLRLHEDEAMVLLHVLATLGG